MKHSHLHLRTLAILALFFLTTQTSFSGEGGTSSGGGNGILYSDGRVRLVDLTRENDLPSEPVSETFIKETFFPESTRYVKTLGYKDDSFFNDATKTFKNSSIPVLIKLSTILKDVPTYKTSLRLTKTTLNDIEMNTISESIPLLSNSSPKFSTDYQEPLAAFSLGNLVVSNPFYEKLSNKGKRGLPVHEGLRVLNLTSLLNKNLSTTEIESLTASLIKHKPISSKILNKLGGFSQETMDKKINIQSLMIKKNLEAMSSSQILKNINELTPFLELNQQPEELKEQLSVRSSISSKLTYYTNSKKNTELNKNETLENYKNWLSTLDSHYIHNVMTKTITQPTKWFDTYTGKIVYKK